MQVAGRSLRPLTMPITDVMKPGQIVILNGAPRSGKSSIVAVIQDTFDGPWMNLGVDVFVRTVTPKRYRPGLGCARAKTTTRSHRSFLPSTRRSMTRSRLIAEPA